MSFPNFVKDHDFKNLMQLMLNKNQTQRFSKLEQIQSHIWFKDFSWDDLISLNMKPAYMPKIESNEKTLSSVYCDSVAMYLIILRACR